MKKKKDAAHFELTEMEEWIRSGGSELSVVLFYRRIADQLITQAAAYRDESSVDDRLLHTLDRYCRSYGKHCWRDTLYFDKNYHAFMEEKESLRRLRQRNEHDQLSQESSRWLVSKEQKAKVIASSQVTETCQSQHHITINTVTQSSPSSVFSYVERAPKGEHITRVTADDSVSSSSNALHDVHISSWLMKEFIELASQNTKKDLETCGVLGGSLEKGVFYVTTLIIPKQESTSNSCQALHEEEVFSVQHEHSLFPVGWIHTHPSQRCFMSSVDLHTHYPYQVMVPEAFAIVMAPTDSSRNFGIFRLTDPAGIAIIKECKEKEFHNHNEPADGGPIYSDCTNVYLNSHMRLEIFDLR